MATLSFTTLPEIAEACLERIESRTAHIGVIGLGYVGLPLSRESTPT